MLQRMFYSDIARGDSVLLRTSSLLYSDKLQPSMRLLRATAGQE